MSPPVPAEQTSVRSSWETANNNCSYRSKCLPYSLVRTTYVAVGPSDSDGRKQPKVWMTLGCFPLRRCSMVLRSCRCPHGPMSACTPSQSRLRRASSPGGGAKAGDHISGSSQSDTAILHYALCILHYTKRKRLAKASRSFCVGERCDRRLRRMKGAERVVAVEKMEDSVSPNIFSGTATGVTYLPG